MSFIDHLEELRWHLIRSVIAIGIGCIVVLIFAKDIVDGVLLAPTRGGFISAKWLCSLGHSIGIGDTLCFPPIDAKFLENKMTGQFISYFTLGFMGGFIVAFPYIFWEFWKFVRPALSDKERKKTRFIIFWVSLLFFTGVAFGYFILILFFVNFKISTPKQPMNKSVFTFILFCFLSRLNAQTLTEAQTERLFKTSQLWGHVTYFHPYLQYKRIPFDSTYAAMIPQLLRKIDVQMIYFILTPKNKKFMWP